MSLASSPDCFSRSEDQAFQALFPSIEQDSTESFDQFFNDGIYTDNEEDNVKEETTEAIDLSAIHAFDLTNDFSHAATSQSQHPSPQPWRKGPWCLNSQPNSQLVVGKTRRAQNGPQSIVSPVHLVADDSLAPKGSQFSNLNQRTKSLSPKRSQKIHCDTSAGQQRLDREMSLSPSPMYARPFYDDRNGFVDVWQQNIQDFNLDLNDDFSEPFQSQIVEYPSFTYAHSRRLHMGNKPQMEGIRAATMYNMNRMTAPKQSPSQSSQELSSRMNANLNAAHRNMFSSTPDPNDMKYRFINEELPEMPDWTTTKSLHSSNSSHNSHNSHNSQLSRSSIENHQGMYNTLPPQEVWSPPSSRAQMMPGLTSRESYPELMQPKPRRATHHVLKSEPLEDPGLGIDYPSSEEIGVAIPYIPVEMQHETMNQIQINYHRSRTNQYNGLAVYPPLPPLPPPTHTYPGQDISPFSTPRRRARAPSRSPSPSISPTRVSRSTRRSPTRRDQSQHRRTKSINKSGPMKQGSETPRQRSMSRGRAPRTPKTPKAGSGDGFGSVGFVNFTPKDASKLLNDVAPSGSSKTRARREQEARDKRKKLSEAAIAAVRRAGGDVDALERAILI